jgi:hypothetical protein
MVAQQIKVMAVVRYRVSQAIGKFETVKQNRADQYRAFCAPEEKEPCG